MGMLALNPVFTRVQLTAVIRGAVASALALPAVPALASALPHDGLPAITLLLLALKERLDPVAGLKRMFETKSFVELVKAIFKVAMLGIVTYVIISDAVQSLVEVRACGLRCAAPIFGTLLTGRASRRRRALSLRGSALL